MIAQRWLKLSLLEVSTKRTLNSSKEMRFRRRRQKASVDVSVRQPSGFVDGRQRVQTRLGPIGLLTKKLYNPAQLSDDGQPRKIPVRNLASFWSPISGFFSSPFRSSVFRPASSCQQPRSSYVGAMELPHNVRIPYGMNLSHLWLR